MQWSTTCLPMQETRVWSLGQEDPLEKGMATHSSILAWRIPMDRGAWWATVHVVAKSRHHLEANTFTFFSLTGGHGKKRWRIMWLKNAKWKTVHYMEKWRQRMGNGRHSTGLRPELASGTYSSYYSRFLLYSWVLLPYLVLSLLANESISNYSNLSVLLISYWDSKLYIN